MLFSTGKNAGAGAGARRSRKTRTEISSSSPTHRPPRRRPDGEFDDIVTWLSPNVLYNRLIAAGQLP
ncbi:MAG: hypothetical protein MZW92_18280 [Comamonadaceae bacterium]|nr:hypothetical protein [Comamonadaceae bacterium]